MKARFVLLLSVLSLLTPLMHVSWSQSQPSAASGPVASVERKLQRLESNGAQAHPDPAPTEFTEQEINAYFASGNVKLPAGVRSVAFQEQPGVVVGTSRVDFDQLKAGKNSYNPLLSVFSGVHEVVVTAHAYGARGEGVVHVDSVSIDGVEVPDFVLQLFVEKYLKPKYPNVGIDSRFALPARIDAATIGLHKVSVTQK
jgi:hypothetical protein